MIQSSHLLHRIGALWLLACALALPGQAQAQRIANTAAAEWQAAGVRWRAASNTVALDVDRSLGDGMVRTYRFAPGGTTRFAVRPTLCRARDGPRTIGLEGVFANLPTDPAELEQVDSIRANEPLVVAIDAPLRNRDPAVADVFAIDFTTPDGDSELLELAETGPDTGTFSGMIMTRTIPPAGGRNDCVVSVAPDTMLRIDLRDGSETAPVIGSVEVSVLVDPFGEVFDSGDGSAVPGTRVTLVDAVTGAPADVFGDDGVSRFPSTVLTGSSVTDEGGTIYAFPPGFYRFPFVRQGTYRLIVEPPDPYRFASAAPPASLAGFRRPDGEPFTLVPGSYGQPFVLDSPAPVRIDIPVDRPGARLGLTKTVSASVAEPGDALRYRIELRNTDPGRATGIVTLTDRLPPQLRLRENSVRLDGERIGVAPARDGQGFEALLRPLAPGARIIVTYLAEVRVDAEPATVANRAVAIDDRGTTSDVGEAFTRIVRDQIADRFTIIGRVTAGGCGTDPRSESGVAGVRVMLQDGTQTVTDATGRYHFEGLLPGLHVAQIDPATLPPGFVPVRCAGAETASGSTISRFVEGDGGMLKRADFRIDRVAGRESSARPAAPQAIPPASEPAPATVVSEREAAGSERDWLAGATPGIAFRFPAEGHNPRSKAIRVVIQHGRDQTVELALNGQPVRPLTFDGTRHAADGSVSVSQWRGIELADRANLLSARVLNADGSLAAELSRPVHLSASPLRAELLRDRSRLLADGISRPVLAVRLTDRDGRPVPHGLTGAFSVSAPHQPWQELEAQQSRQLAGLERARPVWRVEGDEGIALIELAPTTASGSVTLGFDFRDGQATRSQQVEAWLDPGQRDWTVVGFASGTVGYRTLDRHARPGRGADGDDVEIDGRVALYAKGRILGKWLMTLSYDSDREEDETRFGGVIDPRAYYTVYADRSEQRYDAASVRKLYLKLEAPEFYALFGDFETGIVEPELARYQRAFNGIKAEYRSDTLGALAFASDTPNRYRRDEIQGTGLTGPYALSLRDVLPNSEKVRIEVRDRLRSNLIVERRELSRHIDYDIDYAAGTLRFREPVLSRADGFDPQFIIVDYEVDGIAERHVNAGGRLTWTGDGERLRVGITGILEQDELARTGLGGVDLRWRPDDASELRIEAALSDAEARGDVLPGDAGHRAGALLVEAEHHGSGFDALAYYRRQEAGFGTGQLSAAESGFEKFGVDGQALLADRWSIRVSAWQESALDSDLRRRVATADIEFRTYSTRLRAGLAHAEDRLADGRTLTSDIVRLGGSRLALGGRLELGAQTEFALGDRQDSTDFPARHQISLRYAITDSVRLVGAYEIADGESFDSQTVRAGFEVQPWAGARLLGTLNRQSITEFGPRTYAAYGIAQSLRLGDDWTIDATLDGNRTFDGAIDPTTIVNPAQPVASGGLLASTGALTEDFVAVTAGATYRAGDWSWATRAEYRAADSGTRYGFTSAVLKQLGGGATVAGLASWFHAELDGGAATDNSRVELSLAWRPDTSRWSVLDKLELREDRIVSATLGGAAPIGGAALAVDGNVTSRRIVNSLSVNYSPLRDGAASFDERGEFALFWGSRYVFDRFGPDDVEGWSNVVGLDVRFDLGKLASAGAAGTVRVGTDGRNIAWSGGPQASFAPVHNGVVTIGYNVAGFEDRDFEDSRYTRDGPYVTLKLKFDQQSLGAAARRIGF